jgi:hypothetical protein
MKFFMLGLACLLFVSCASNDVPQSGNFKGPFRGGYLSRISIGMPKTEALRQIGEPFSVGATGGGEVFTYRDDQKGWWQYDYYFVRFIDGKVESYGRQNIDQPVVPTPAPAKSSP